jgi:bacteriocin-like protein
MKELSIKQMEQVKGGTCSSDELFANAAKAAEYGYKFLRYGGNFYEFMYTFYTAKTMACI